MQIFVNNIKCNVHPSETILQVCERLKINIPKFCYHKKLKVAGNCRMCLVEIEGAPKPIASCASPVTENMKIYTNTPFVYKARENVLELLLLNHPLDCKICDQGGECDLQEHSKTYGTDRSRNYHYVRRGVENKFLGPIVKTEMTRCIHCTRCVRFIEQITGKAVLGTLTRGRNTEIGTFVKEFLKNELSGNLVDICPVGALTLRPRAFQYRSWELEKIPNIDLSDSFGSSINILTKNKTIGNINVDAIIKIMPRPDENLNGYWISDRTRFAYSEGLTFNRLKNSYFIDQLTNKQLNLTVDVLMYLFFYLILNTTNYFYFRFDENKKFFNIFFMNMQVFNVLFNTVANEKALNWQFGFQIPASPVAEGIINFHHDLFFFLVVIVTFVFYVLFRTIARFAFFIEGHEKGLDPHVSFSHAPVLEIVWTIIPALILITISIPSFSLLYSIDEVLQALFNIKVIGHQWYWSYEILNAEFVFNEIFRSNINNYLSEKYPSLLEKLENKYDSTDNIISYDSYMRTEENIVDIRDRLLAVDAKVYIPVEANVRILVTAADVLHCWTVPALGVKMDGCPGRINQTSVFAKRPGTFYGQCSEICGINHGFMPINVTAVDIVGNGLRVKENSKGLAAIYEFLIKQKIAPVA